MLDILPTPIHDPDMALTGADARKLIRRLLDEGCFVVPIAGSHARKEMDKDELSDLDAVNVLRGGVVREAEWENGSWRYRVETPRMAFVVTFDPDQEQMPSGEQLQDIELVVVTGWRIRK